MNQYNNFELDEFEIAMNCGDKMTNKKSLYSLLVEHWFNGPKLFDNPKFNLNCWNKWVKITQNHKLIQNTQNILKHFLKQEISSFYHRNIVSKFQSLTWHHIDFSFNFNLRNIETIWMTIPSWFYTELHQWQLMVHLVRFRLPRTLDSKSSLRAKGVEHRWLTTMPKPNRRQSFVFWLIHSNHLEDKHKKNNFINLRIYLV